MRHDNHSLNKVVCGGNSAACHHKNKDNFEFRFALFPSDGMLSGDASDVCQPARQWRPCLPHEAPHKGEPGLESKLARASLSTLLVYPSEAPHKGKVGPEN